MDYYGFNRDEFKRIVDAAGGGVAFAALTGANASTIWRLYTGASDTPSFTLLAGIKAWRPDYDTNRLFADTAVTAPTDGDRGV